MWRLADRYLGRGAYPRLRSLIAPERGEIQDAYPLAVLHALQSHSRWLDAGCGHTLFEPRFASLEAVARRRASLIVGCDADLTSLRKHTTLSQLVASDLGCLAFSQGSFDLVTLHWVAEHVPDPEPVFLEIARILAPGGLLILRTPNASSYYVRVGRLAHRVLPRALVHRLIRHLQHREPEDVFPAYYRANTVRSLRTAAQEAGLVAERIILYADEPLFYFIAPLAALEMALAKIGAFWLGWQELCADSILAVFRQPGRPRGGAHQPRPGSAAGSPRAAS